MLFSVRAFTLKQQFGHPLSLSVFSTVFEVGIVFELHGSEESFIYHISYNLPEGKVGIINKKVAVGYDGQQLILKTLYV